MLAFKRIFFKYDLVKDELINLSIMFWKHDLFGLEKK